MSSGEHHETACDLTGYDNNGCIQHETFILTWVIKVHRISAYEADGVWVRNMHGMTKMVSSINSKDKTIVVLQ
jgi:hypothetical protein